MPLGFSHLVGAWLPAKLVEYYRKKEFSKWTWIALLFGAILPDADFLLEWLGLAVGIHRTFSHSLLFIPFTWLVIYGVSIFLLEYLPKKYVPKNEYPRTLAWAAALGVAFHIFFDCLLYPGVNLLWPFNWWFAAGTLYYSTQTAQSPDFLQALIL